MGKCTYCEMVLFYSWGFVCLTVCAERVTKATKICKGTSFVQLATFVKEVTAVHCVNVSKEWTKV